MKKKSEKKRKAILDVATQMFGEFGFERTSMSEICSRVGGSKATLYKYFPSKEELFIEVMFISVEAEFEATHSCLDPNAENIEETLLQFGFRILTFGYSPRVLAGRRLMVAEAGRSNFGPEMFERGPERSKAEMAKFLRSAMTRGKLKKTDVKVATQHLYGLLDAEIHDRYMLCPKETISAATIRKVVRRAIDVFMKAYGN
jgi:AcrR family transcriptional regulator